jgi:hypothetical protein
VPKAKQKPSETTCQRHFYWRVNCRACQKEMIARNAKRTQRSKKENSNG